MNLGQIDCRSEVIIAMFQPQEFFLEIPDLNDVRIFVLIAQAGTLTAAARDLSLPTSTVSRSLTRLEKQLDVLLMRRSLREAWL